MRRHFVPACTGLESRLVLSATVLTTIGSIGQVVHTEVGNTTIHLPTTAAHVVTTIGSIGQVVHTQAGSTLHLPGVSVH